MCRSVKVVEIRRDMDGFVKEKKNRCSIEFGAFVYALIHFFIAGISFVISVIWLIYHVFQYFVFEYYDKDLLINLINTGILGGAIVISFTSFVFGTMLLKGIVTGRPGLIKAYVIYGFVAVITTICLFSTPVAGNLSTSWKLTVVGVCAFFLTILIMLWMTYKKYQRIINRSNPTTVNINL